jgi:hypothetical protein
VWGLLSCHSALDTESISWDAENQFSMTVRGHFDMRNEVTMEKFDRKTQVQVQVSSSKKLLSWVLILDSCLLAPVKVSLLHKVPDTFFVSFFTKTAIKHSN